MAIIQSRCSTHYILQCKTESMLPTQVRQATILKVSEYVLHLGYKLAFQSWWTSKNTLPIKEAARERIQIRFITESIHIKESRVGYTIYNSKTAVQIWLKI
ncbi:hypothetical protein HHI36_006928, partial [Cryptolaemus montrouzieri]